MDWIHIYWWIFLEPDPVKKKKRNNSGSASSEVNYVDLCEKIFCNAIFNLSLTCWVCERKEKGVYPDPDPEFFVFSFLPDPFSRILQQSGLFRVFFN